MGLMGSIQTEKKQPDRKAKNEPMDLGEEINEKGGDRRKNWGEWKGSTEKRDIGKKKATQRRPQT